MSFLFRLSEVNCLRTELALLRALGDPATAKSQPCRDWINTRDITLNLEAQQRLVGFTGIPITRLRKVFPALRRPHPDPPTTSGIAQFHVFSPGPGQLRDHCDDCVARIPGRPRIRVHSCEAPRVCRRHNRWIHTGYANPHQFNLTGVGEIAVADRKFSALCSSNEDQEWAADQVEVALKIVGEWFRSHPNYTFKQLNQRWTIRRDRLPAGTSPNLLLLPEAVTIATALCDMDWRRHVAMVNTSAELALFYHHIGRILGQPRKFSQTMAWGNYVDPLKKWVIGHRNRHVSRRAEFWHRVRTHRPYNPYMQDAIFPPNRHFK
ncbi:hypothetical protein AB0M12_10850 [Nocardia vinacea]|uniref:hypothetical protein n=1 Tax=Nocardia vinacea TaxID=96468 RepID=UPI00341DC55D